VSWHEYDTSNSGAGVRGRRPNQREQEIFDLWDKMKLNTHDFASGQIVAFLGQLRRPL
jgi:hypothetical protein